MRERFLGPSRLFVLAIRRGEISKLRKIYVNTMFKTPIDLPDALSEYGRNFKDFQAALQDDLRENIDSGELSLQDLCTGNTPDRGSDYTFYISGRRSYRDDELFRIACDFDQQIPTGCDGIKILERVVGEIVVGFDARKENAYLAEDYEWPDDKDQYTLPI